MTSVLCFAVAAAVDREEFRGLGFGHWCSDASTGIGTTRDLPWDGDDPTLLERARAVDGRVVLAGGLGPDNVAGAVAAARPWAVDASSSLEVEPGIKDHDRVRAFVAAAR
jgi:phosphoribosylanthranilate isomerase